METLASAPLTAAQQATATAWLHSTADQLRTAVDGLSPTQASFKPNPSRWSIAEIVEHIALIETRIHSLIDRLPHAAIAESGRNDDEIDAVVLARVPDRSVRVEAPAPVCPTGQYTVSDSLERFREARTHTLQLLASATHLRGRVLPHPIFGNWDGYQWLLAAGSHSARHTAQIHELKADPSFPTI